MAAWAPKRNHSTWTALRAAPRSASKSATGERMGGPVQTLPKQPMTGEILGAVRA
jgi:hypothetical protein